ncbi:MAG TPA: EAL domain-containing protein [Steroidobacteraceae bacterium]|jgi:diguanylate cyclase (GGDEF)-like protein/PAS domain S-box-containing protein|nr:EAL domain-containing protein [Steroidobacteraceae bacterium]
MNTRKIKVLMVEDRADDVDILLREMRSRGLTVIEQRVDTGPAFEAALGSFEPDLILSDYTLPGFDGIAALEIAQSKRPDTPFIFVSGTIGEERAIQALKQGAVDYVLKDNRGRLVPAIERALREAEDRDARRWAQRELEESEERFRFAMHFSSIGMALVAPDGRWLGINPALCDIVGYVESELLATDVRSISHPEDRDVDSILIRDMLDRKIETYQTNKRFVRKDGRVVWTQMSGSLVWLQSGEPHYFIYQIQDITDRVNAERALRDSEERFRTIAEATQEWIWELDAQGVYTFCSPAVESILGYTPEQLVGTSCLEIVAPNIRNTVSDLLKRGVAEKRGWRDLVLHMRHAKGGIRWVDSNALPLLDASDHVYGYRGVARDITDHRLQQERIARLSRIQAVLSGINSTIVRVRERRELLSETCRIAVQQGGFRMAWIGLVEPNALKATPLVWDGFEQGYLDEIGLTLANRDVDPGPVGEALRQKRVVVVNDIEASTEPLLKREALVRGFRSQMAMPLMVDDQAVGILVLYAAETGFFDYEELKLLKDLAGDISFALDYIGKEEKLTYVSYYDTLTGLANRQLFFDRLAQALHAARAEHRQLAVIIIDLQRFKRINDTLGRYAGDQVLKELANRLQKTISESATPARIGGDRFALVVPNLPGTSMARWIEDWIVNSFAEPLIIDEIELRTSVKLGIAMYPADADTAESLFVNAEAALKRAKDAADSYLFYSPEMNARVAHRLRLESRLRKAVQQKEFILHYQTKVDLATRRVRGLEALIRWNDPDYGVVSPHDFVPLLEESGLIVEVGLWVIRQAIADMQAWRGQGLEVPRIAVNVSEVQLRQPSFVAAMLAALGPGANHATGIDVEITESMIAQNTGANVQKLLRLREAGVQVFMDDFGTGYSGLSQIAHLPLDALKIDRAFVAGMTISAEHMAIVSAIINLAKALKIYVVAEGVETEEQAARLHDLGCDEAQGYLFSRPAPASEITQLLTAAH